MPVLDENCRCSPCLHHPRHLITTHPSSTLFQPSSSYSQALLPTPFPYITNTVDPPHPQHSPAALLRLGSRHSSHRTPLDHLALVARGTNLPRPHRSVMIGKIVLGRLSHPGHCTDSRKKNYPQSACEKDIYLSWSFNLRDRLQHCCSSRGCRRTCREHRQEDAVFVPSHCCILPRPWHDLLGSSSNELIHSQEGLVLATIAQKHSQISWSGGQQGLQTHRTIYIF